MGMPAYCCVNGMGALSRFRQSLGKPYCVTHWLIIGHPL